MVKSSPRAQLWHRREPPPLPIIITAVTGEAEVGHLQKAVGSVLVEASSRVELLCGGVAPRHLGTQMLVPLTRTIPEELFPRREDGRQDRHREHRLLYRWPGQSHG